MPDGEAGNAEAEDLKSKARSPCKDSHSLIHS